MCRKSSSFTTHMVSAILKKVSKEAADLEKKGTFKPGGEDKFDKYQQLNWKSIQKDLKETCPILLQVLQSVVPGGRRPTRLEQVRMITAISVLMFLRRPGQNKLIQELTGIMLWLAGCKTETLVRLNRLGMSTNQKSTSRSVDMIRNAFDGDLKRHKESIERVCGQAKSAADERLLEESQVSSDLCSDMNEGGDQAHGGSNGADCSTAISEAHPSSQDNTQSLPNTDLPHDGSSKATYSTPAIEPHLVHHDYTRTWPDTDHSDDGSSRATCSAPSSADNTPTGNGADLAHGESSGADGSTPIIEPHPTSDDNTPTSPDAEKADMSSNHVGFTMMVGNVDQPAGTKPTSTDPLNLFQCYAAMDRVPCFHLSDVHPSIEDIEAISEEVFLPSKKDVELLRMEYLVTIKRILSSHIPVFKKMKTVDHIPHPHAAETKKKSKIFPFGILQKTGSKVSKMADVLDHLTQYVPKDSSSQPIPLLLFGDQESCERHRDAQDALENEELEWDRLSGLHPAIQEWNKRVLTLQDDFALLYNIRSMRSSGTLSFIKKHFGFITVNEKIPICFDDATSLLRFTTEGYVLAAALHLMGITSVHEAGRDEITTDIAAYFDRICNEVLDLAFHPPYQNLLHEEEDTPVGHPSCDQGEPASSKPSMEDGPSSSTSHYCLCRSVLEEDMIGCDNPACDRGSWFHYSCISLSKSKVPQGVWFCSRSCKKDAARSKKDTARNKEDTARNKKDAARNKEDAARNKEDAARNKEDAARNKEDASRNKKDTARNKKDTARNKEDTARNKEDTARNKEDTARNKEDTARNKKDTARNKKDTARNKKDTARNKEDAARNKKDTARNKKDAARNKKDTARNKEDAARNKEDAARNKKDTARNKKDAARNKKDTARNNNAEKPVQRKCHKFEYTKAVLFHGLGEMVRYDAIREGDGNRILAHWRFDMLRFYANQHLKYLTEGHHLLMDVNGALSPRLAYQLTWNRTVNIQGGSGRNVSMDLEMETLNKDFKKFMKSAVGIQIDHAIHRYNQTVGLKACVAKFFDRKGSGKEDKKSAKSSQDKDTITLAEMLLNEGCLEEVVGRGHAGFERFEFQGEFTQQEKFKERMSMLSWKRLEREMLSQL
ncbi:uncharacterized protein [Diadema setosum]|uniref:uncharacterized protein n=1 Tax=Diadema setosum TaxID=31175 RepID=UPI003B3BDCAD